ncbi:hypothetical protein [Algoriphagus confluentis]|uniref:Carboxypeptidase regulatory-like domain-containing protein n=1 Tax=Algoriphagus confluentis TaxID=1697556 RepID=A0ABQ6PUU1_9BACT|nr:hypothetical protein Aconfl_41630 [Algoriphagus confluentis]
MKICISLYLSLVFLTFPLLAQDIKFDKESTLPFIKDGSSSIYGSVFARDNTSPIKGMAVLNMNPKQMARKGTEIILIPYTDYFKFWSKENKKRSKKGVEPLTLPEEAYECIAKTEVKDDEGNYSFSGLMPGKYLLMTNFDYDHTYSVTRTEGYVNSYIGNMYIGSSPIERIYHYQTQSLAYVEKIVEIKNEGERVKADLKRTK